MAAHREDSSVLQMTPDLSFWVSIRQALLTAVDAVERLVNAGLKAQKKPPKFEPRTAELRKVARKEHDETCCEGHCDRY